jgi:hypothetical protein
VLERAPSTLLLDQDPRVDQDAQGSSGGPISRRIFCKSSANASSTGGAIRGARAVGSPGAAERAAATGRRPGHRSARSRSPHRRRRGSTRRRSVWQPPLRSSGPLHRRYRINLISGSSVLRSSDASSGQRRVPSRAATSRSGRSARPDTRPDNGHLLS